MKQAAHLISRQIVPAAAAIVALVVIGLAAMVLLEPCASAQETPGLRRGSEKSERPVPPRTGTTEGHGATTQPAPPPTPPDPPSRSDPPPDNGTRPQRSVALDEQIKALDTQIKHLATEVERLRQLIGQVRPAPPTVQTGSGWSIWEFLTLVLLGLATLALVGLMAASSLPWMRPRPAKPEGVVAARVTGNAPQGVDVGALVAVLRDQVRHSEDVTKSIQQIGANLQSLQTDLRRLSVSVPSRPVEAPRTASVPPPGPSRPVEPSVDFKSQTAAVKADFNRMVVDDSGINAFIERWRPQSVAMVNFEQRVRESGFAPELIVRDRMVGGGEEHFWFVRFRPTQFGLVLPARRLLLHRAALRGADAAKLFRRIFEMTPSENFTLERPALAELIGEKLEIKEEGSIALPY